jgi:hypothetical protein
MAPANELRETCWVEPSLHLADDAILQTTNMVVASENAHR